MRKSFLWPQTLADIEGWKHDDRWRVDFSTDLKHGRIDVDVIVANISKKMTYNWAKVQ